MLLTRFTEWNQRGRVIPPEAHPHREQKTAAPAAPARGKIQTKHIVVPFEVKTIDEEARTFTGLAAAFALDLGGDVILPGAFKRTLADWKRSKGRRIIYLIDSHNYRSVINVAGKMVDAEETADGLLTTQEVIANDPTGDAVWKRITGGFINGMSIGYSAIQVQYATPEQQLTGIYRYLKEVKLEENSLVIWPMNEEARVDAIKSLLDEAKHRELTTEELAELKEWNVEIQALLAKTAPAPVEAPPGDKPAEPETEKAAPVVVTLAPDDPKRIAMSEALRELTLRALSAR